MSAKNAVLVDASMEAKYELTNAHLWLEEYVDGDNTITKEKIEKHIDEAKWYLNAMIYGGRNSENNFLAIDKSETSMISDIKECLVLIDYFEKITNKRILNKIYSGSKFDTEYDKLFEKTINKIDDIETKLQEIIRKDLNYYQWIHYLLIIGIIVINLFVLFSYKTILKYQKEWLFKYFQIENDKNKLDNLYKDIQQAQAIIDKYVPISTANTEGKITSVNSAMCNLTGYSKEELIGQNYRMIKFPTEKSTKFKELWNTLLQEKIWEGEFKNKNKDGYVYWASAHIHPMYSDEGNLTGYRAIHENITEKKKLEYESTHDNLTSVYNRNKFDEILDYEISQYKRYKKNFSLAIIDLDHFKNVNDTYGHHIGDEVLIQSVKIINESIRSTDILARWGGEEFVLLLPYASISQAKIVAQKVRKAIESHRFDTVGKLTVSIGLSEITKEDTSTSIFERIDSALYEAKESGRNKVVYKDIRNK